MTAGRDSLAYRRLRAPREHATALIDPTVDQVPSLIAENVTQRRAVEYDFGGRSLQALAETGRQELLQAARHYTSSYRPARNTSTCERLFLAGHQPELFHPGVWYKNFALSQLAREQGGVAVNLVIDSDTIKHVSLRVPGGTIDAPVVESMSFDSSADEIPYEERDIEDRGLFDSFGERAMEWLRPLVSAPLMDQFWSLVRGRTAVTRNLGECLSQARHKLEGEWGLDTLELPQSQVCSLPTFHWFTAHLLRNLDRFRDHYNRAVNAYRHINKVRSANHPVPNLATDGDWIEAPYWLWTSSSPRRRRVFVRQHAGGLTLTDRRRVEVQIPLSEGDGFAPAVEALAGLATLGIKLRSRALVTTLFARLILSDLFIHGIGGAKYDQLTDELISGFFGVTPPGYLVVSATLHLAAPAERVSPDEVPRVDRELRDLEYHPERYLAGLHTWTGAPVDVARWLELKSRWLATEQTRENGRERCHAIRAANEALQAWIEPRRRELVRRRQEAARQSRVASVLTSREYAFCLYPTEELRHFLLDFPRTTS